ncbi:outer membrane beta-barrel protein [Spirosoma sp. KCTC 42546]|uniref:outer membrane beta-barrel protein n=1 Tax=Spirosoma sp. KCTC 42546 TaxID=2520506 RepID=UPI00143DF731|nr:outer membrane beta-barrel protein [Spirosoma sp. KCTC 42546]
MKAIVCTIALVIAGFSSAMAQTEKGNRLMGVNVANIIIPTSGNTNKATIISLQPTYGWFISNGLVVGAGIPFYHLGADNSKLTQIGIAPFLRYYIGPSQVKPFLGASVGIVNTSASVNGSASSTSTDPIYSVTGGVAFFMNRHVSFDMALAYTGGDIGAINSYLGGTTNALTPNIPKALNFSLGFQVYFGRN